MQWWATVGIWSWLYRHVSDEQAAGQTYCFSWSHKYMKSFFSCIIFFYLKYRTWFHVLIVAEVPKVPEQPSKKAKVEESEVPSTESDGPAPIVISEALAKFFGTSEKEMLQSEVYNRIEEYIKTKGLEVGLCLFLTPFVLFLNLQINFNA